MRKFVMTPLALAVLSASAYAADEAPKTFTLDKVTVSATLTEQKLKDVASTVTVIDAETLEKTSATDIRNMLRYEPGIEVGSSGRFGLQGFNIRGMDENQVKIVIDGVDQTKAFSPGGDFQQANRNFIDIDAMKRVDVVKGPASSLYGSNAIGGVVSFTTKDPSDYLSAQGDDFFSSLKMQHTSENDGNHATLTLANRSGQLESLLVYTRRDYNEQETQGSAGGEGQNRTKANPQGSTTDNILAKLQYQINDAHRLGLTLEHSETDTDINNLRGNYVLDMGAFGTIAYDDNRSEDTYKRTRIGIEHSWQAELAAFDALHWSLNQQETTSEHNTFDSIAPTGMATMFVAGDGPRINEYSNKEDSLQFAARFNKALGNQAITYGFNYETTDATNETGRIYTNGSAPQESGRYYPKVESVSYGAFIQSEIELLDGKLTLTPSVRYDNFEASPETDARFTESYDDHDSDKISAGLGSVYRFDANWSVFAQYAQGFKTPDIGDMYYARNGGNYLRLSNPDLKPEESDSYEIGLRYQSNIASVEISAFYNDYENFIEQVNLDDTYQGTFYTGGVTQHTNVSEATIKGIELRSSIWLDEALGAPQGTSLHTSLAYADGEGQSDGESGDTPLNSIAPLKAVLGLDYHSPDDTWGSSLNLTLVEEKFEKDMADPSQARTHGYGLVDLTGYYHINKQLKISGGIYNLTDKKYTVWEDVRGRDADTNLDYYSEPGRHFSLSASYAF